MIRLSLVLLGVDVVMDATLQLVRKDGGPVVLFMNGIGTLLFILITKGKAPAYLGSSFAFLAPAGIVIEKWGYSYALGGFVAVGFLGCVLALIIRKFGSKWIDVVQIGRAHV